MQGLESRFDGRHRPANHSQGLAVLAQSPSHFGIARDDQNGRCRLDRRSGWSDSRSLREGYNIGMGVIHDGTVISKERVERCERTQGDQNEGKTRVTSDFDANELFDVGVQPNGRVTRSSNEGLRLERIVFGDSERHSATNERSWPRCQSLKETDRGIATNRNDNGLRFQSMTGE